MRYLVVVFAGILMSACGGNVRTSEPVQYDFGDIGGDGPAWRLPVVVEVQAAPWLAGSGMHFRLTYAEPLRRQMEDARVEHARDLEAGFGSVVTLSCP